MPGEEQENKIPVSQMDDAEAALLCDRLRKRLIDTVSHTGGHLASSLGALELIVSLHRVFDTGRDRLVFDVGHQCYAHKLLTGRDGAFDSLRSFGGISGFPKPSESVHDAFVAGHASNAVSVALGMARARTLLNEDYHVIALLGDGALTGGLAYEGLNDAGESNQRLIVILNDNGMSIRKNVGGIAQHLAHMRIRPSYYRFKKVYHNIIYALPGGKKLYKIIHQVKTALKQAILPSSLFEDMGFTYLGPVDGHDLGRLHYLLGFAKEMETPVLIHVMTQKGKGYAPAEQRPDCYHGVNCFDVETGLPLKEHKADFSQVFGDTLCALAEDCPNLCAVTAAMRDGTGLNGFAECWPDRFFDVGIAEGHAVSMAAGMAKQGMVPVFAVYSTFLQRGFDMLIHDVALQNLHVVRGVDRAGLVGQDGETHHGVFDVGYLSVIPGMKIYCPASFAELRDMLRAAVRDDTGPVAIRYPRGAEGTYRDGYQGRTAASSGWAAT
jgi:1-deoxy-D-xylulose-5-phosphate synthase